MTKRQKPQLAMFADQGTQLVHLVTQSMHLIPDTSLEQLVDNLRAEMRRGGD